MPEDEIASTKYPPSQKKPDRDNRSGLAGLLQKNEAGDSEMIGR